jgi:N-acetylglucosaminyl-diphospho-decaprenol L-rhamnosyltransferase
MTLSIVIVSFNAREDLENCLRSLAAAPPRIPHEVVVVDNASSDDSVAAVEARFPDVRLLVQRRNLGFSAANNTGIRATSGELILLLNNDTVVPAGALDVLVDRLVAHEEAAVAGPRLVDASGAVELSFGPMIAPLAEARQKLLRSLYERGFGLARSWVERATARERFVDWVSGACLLVRRADAEAVGLLDERYFLYTEDVDFCAAIRASGRRVLFTPRAQVVHLRGRSRATVADRMNAAYRRSQIAFYEKHHPRWAPVLRAYLAVRGHLPPPQP